jgi:hypothetical protein
MTEWIDVSVAGVAVGDEVKVDGFGEFLGSRSSVVELNGMCWETVTYVEPRHFNIKDGGDNTRFRRSSIVACRRRKPEPQPKPGHWQSLHEGMWERCECHGNDRRSDSSFPHRVYRASGWSPDTRTVDRRKK